MSGCEQLVVAISNEWMQTTCGCEPRAVANSNKLLLIATSRCEPRVVADTACLSFKTNFKLRGVRFVDFLGYFFWIEVASAISFDEQIS